MIGKAGALSSILALHESCSTKFHQKDQASTMYLHHVHVRPSLLLASSWQPSRQSTDGSRVHLDLLCRKQGAGGLVCSCTITGPSTGTTYNQDLYPTPSMHLLQKCKIRSSVASRLASLYSSLPSDSLFNSPGTGISSSRLAVRLFEEHQYVPQSSGISLALRKLATIYHLSGRASEQSRHMFPIKGSHLAPTATKVLGKR